MDAELLKKLRFKDGQAAAVWNAPEGYRLEAEGVSGSEAEMAGPFDFLLLFVNSAQEVLDKLPGAVSALNEDAVFWLAYPKKTARLQPDINRDSLFSLVQSLSSYRAVSNVAIDEKWSALRFRHQDKVKK